MSLKIAKDWVGFLQPLFSTESYTQLTENLKRYRIDKRDFYPKADEIFAAFNHCKLANVKVVILGQDPYHGKGQADGLSFSVNKGVSIPPSLKNIIKELEADINIPKPQDGNLINWAQEGVLLLNAVLTVFPNQAASHRHIGWQKFTDSVISKLSDDKENIVFVLWGNYAQKKARLIDAKKHLILKSVHPSPLSAHRGFFGNNHFSAANAYLVEHSKQPVDWCID